LLIAFGSAYHRQPEWQRIGKPCLRASWRIRRAFLSVGLLPQCTYLLQLLRAYHELLVKLDARLVGLIPAEYPGSGSG